MLCAYKMSNILKLLKCQLRRFSTKPHSCVFSREPQVLSLKDNVSLNSNIHKFEFQTMIFKRLSYSNFSSRAYDVNTKVIKDVIIYKYENPRFFKIMNIFALCQFVFWTYLSHFAFTTLRDAPVEQAEGLELKWYERINLGQDKYRNGITILSFTIGYATLTAVWLFILRSVRFLILRKGGENVTIVTYAPFGHNRIMTVPLKNLSAQLPREKAEGLLPIKVRNRSLFYVLDMKGEFKNTQLYDYTAGLNRHF